MNAPQDASLLLETVETPASAAQTSVGSGNLDSPG